MYEHILISFFARESNVSPSFSICLSSSFIRCVACYRTFIVITSTAMVYAQLKPRMAVSTDRMHRASTYGYKILSWLQGASIAQRGWTLMTRQRRKSALLRWTSSHLITYQALPPLHSNSSPWRGFIAKIVKSSLFAS